MPHRQAIVNTYTSSTRSKTRDVTVHTHHTISEFLQVVRLSDYSSSRSVAPATSKASGQCLRLRGSMIHAVGKLGGATETTRGRSSRRRGRSFFTLSPTLVCLPRAAGTARRERWRAAERRHRLRAATTGGGGGGEHEAAVVVGALVGVGERGVGGVDADESARLSGWTASARRRYAALISRGLAPGRTPRTS